MDDDSDKNKKINKVLADVLESTGIDFTDETFQDMMLRRYMNKQLKERYGHLYDYHFGKSYMCLRMNNDKEKDNNVNSETFNLNQCDKLLENPWITNAESQEVGINNKENQEEIKKTSYDQNKCEDLCKSNLLEISHLKLNNDVDMQQLIDLTKSWKIETGDSKRNESDELINTISYLDYHDNKPKNDTKFYNSLLNNNEVTQSLSDKMERNTTTIEDNIRDENSEEIDASYHHQCTHLINSSLISTSKSNENKTSQSSSASQEKKCFENAKTSNERIKLAEKDKQVERANFSITQFVYEDFKFEPHGSDVIKYVVIPRPNETKRNSKKVSNEKEINRNKVKNIQSQKNVAVRNKEQFCTNKKVSDKNQTYSHAKKAAAPGTECQGAQTLKILNKNQFDQGKTIREGAPNTGFGSGEVFPSHSSAYKNKFIGLDDRIKCRSVERDINEMSCSTNNLKKPTNVQQRTNFSGTSYDNDYNIIEKDESKSAIAEISDTEIRRKEDC